LKVSPNKQPETQITENDVEAGAEPTLRLEHYDSSISTCCISSMAGVWKDVA
jgi:hypothetical protein